MCNQGIGVIRTIIILYTIYVCIYVILSMLAKTSGSFSAAAYMHSLYDGFRFTMRSDFCVQKLSSWFLSRCINFVTDILLTV